MFRIITVLLLGLLCTGVMAETLYRWVDERGNAQFGQHPPANRPFSEVNLRASQPPGGEAGQSEPQPATAPAPAPAQPSMAEPPQQAPRAMPAAERIQRCANARKEVETLENNPRLARTLPSGERERIGEEERQQMIAQSRADIERYCD